MICKYPVLIMMQALCSISIYQELSKDFNRMKFREDVTQNWCESSISESHIKVFSFLVFFFALLQPILSDQVRHELIRIRLDYNLCLKLILLYLYLYCNALPFLVLLYYYCVHLAYASCIFIHWRDTAYMYFR